MFNYIKADLFRLMRRIPRWILIGFFVLLTVVAFVPSSSATLTGAENVRNFEDYIRYVPVVIGFIEMLYVFTDDFKGKTAQIAIGLGVSRHHVVLSKWLEFVILAIADTFLILFATWITLRFTKFRFPTELYGEVLICCCMCVVTSFSCMALVLPLLFATQGTTIPLLIYVFLAAGWLNKVVVLIGSIKEIAFLHINNFSLTNCLNVFRTRWILGSFHPWAFIGIIIYTAAYIALTVVLYKKKELDF